MLGFVKRPIARRKRPPTDDDLTGIRPRDVKEKEQAPGIGYSPPPPPTDLDPFLDAVSRSG